MALCTLGVSAQRKGKAPKVVQPVVPVNARYESMLPSTQEVVFFDSIVVDKSALISSIPMDGDMGSLTDSITFSDSRGLHAFFAKPGETRLFMANCIDGRWTDERPVECPIELNDIHFPYMMPDGETLYFSARTDEGVGKLDLYVTRYDSETCSLMEPDNIGLPFSSEANDYLYVISERDKLGYFATDRRQPEGKVCIYFFEPNTQRQTYDPSKVSDAQLRRLADLRSIAASAGTKSQRDACRTRLSAFRGRLQGQGSEVEDFRFVVSNDRVYTSWNDFRNPEARDFFVTLRTTQNQLRQLMADTQLLRLQYSDASGDGRRRLAASIKSNEAQQLRLSQDVAELEKKIREREK